MTDICKSEICTGCGTCIASCPKKAISFTTGFLGHVYPSIDQKKCIGCGICQTVCPALSEQEKHLPSAAYAVWSKDETDYKSSTSGGAASVLSQLIISQGGVVYGCAMLPNVDVKHIRVDRLEDLPNLKGSKYVQSSLTEVLPLIKQDIKDGKKVLFIGTPCQCAAVKKMFRQEPDNLYLVDLICHGVPSLKFLQEHVHNKVGTLCADKVVFRDEKGRYSIIVNLQGKELYRVHLKESRYKDLYINTFFDGFTFRDSCYTCQYAQPNRGFDITIGDFWGLGEKFSVDEIPQHPYGCSVILPSSDKGRELVEQIRTEMNMYERTVQEAVDGNDQLQQPFRKNMKRIYLFRMMVRMGFPANVYKLVVLDLIVKCAIRKIIK